MRQESDKSTINWPLVIASAPFVCAGILTAISFMFASPLDGLMGAGHASAADRVTYGNLLNAAYVTYMIGILLAIVLAAVSSGRRNISRFLVSVAVPFVGCFPGLMIITNVVGYGSVFGNLFQPEFGRGALVTSGIAGLVWVGLIVFAEFSVYKAWKKRHKTADLPELIGISGSFASGKDTLAHYLVENDDFTHASTGDMLREVAMEKYGNVERSTLRKTGTELRCEKGAGVLVAEALRKPRPLVITGIRSLGEAKELKNAGGILVFVDAPVEIRYERMKSRQRDDETKLTLQEFSQNEESEWYGGADDADFNLRGIREMADVQLQNVGTPEEFVAAALAGLAK